MDDAQVLDSSRQYDIKEAQVTVGLGHDLAGFDHDDGVEFKAFG